MKAAVLEHYGAPENFIIKDVKEPEIKDKQILIRNQASSVNPVDTLVREGKLKLISGLLSEHITGCDFAGTVIATKSSYFKEGDEVFGFKSAASGHTYAEVVAVDEDNAASKPSNTSFTEAASLALVSLTAWQGLMDEGGLKSGDRILINGCTGGVGAAAVQIAKSAGATVIGTCKGEYVNKAKEMGCDEVLNYESESIPKGKQYNLIFDTAAKLTLTDVEESLADEGLLVTTNPDTEDIKSAFSSIVDLAKKRMKIVMAKPNTKDLSEIKKLVEEGKMRPYIAKIFPLAEISKAHTMQETKSFTGKIAIEIP